MFSSRLSLTVLIELCRSLRHYLGAGLSLVDVFKMQAKRGPAPLRATAEGFARDMERGDSLEDCLQRESKLFPPLMLSLSAVGERTGMLPEVFHELERYFTREKDLRRKFLAQIAWPVFQFCGAVVVLTLMIFVLGQIGDGKFDPLGLGLTGTTGAMVFFFGIVGSIAAVLVGLSLVSRMSSGKAAVSTFLLGVPALGPCIQALALGRFCLALRLTTESGMSIGKALGLSLKATGNPAFADKVSVVKSTVREGEPLTLALTRTRLFPDDLLRIIEVAEESGTLTDVLRHQGDHYHEEASRRMTALTAVAGYGIWAMVALAIIVAIFRIYGTYLGMIDQVLPR